MSPQTQTPIVWLVSPYHSGSHLSWAEGYANHSRHRVVPLTMAGRFWKWRMQGGPIELAEQARQLLARQQLATGGPPAAILATDMLNLPVWLGLLRGELPGDVPVFLYMHENQLTYPPRPNEQPDLTYAMTNWLSQLAADQVIFNSDYHRQSWFGALPTLLKHFPDYNHLEKLEAVQARSVVLPVGIRCGRIDEARSGAGERKDEPPLILWNQRWEYDKRPDRFFRLLYRLAEEGIDFRLAVAGENFRREPEEFEEARTRLADRIVQWGFVKSASAYRSLLCQADLVISTADHEFFGISILEAIAGGAFPLLPNRLSYPELIPAELHPACLYEDEDDLYEKAAHRLQHPRAGPPSLQTHVREHFDWPVVAAQYDQLVF
jgi:glycosyltransferase involved in cell wall biosynthesis